MAALPPVHYTSAPLAMPLAVPAGNQSWEVKTSFDTNQFTTEAIQWTIKQSVLITSFRPSVVFRASPLVYVPDILEMLEVSLTLDDDWILTQETNQAGGTPVSGAFITLASVHPKDRLWNLQCVSATPRISATFRSKVGTATPAASGLPATAIVSLTAIGWYLDKDGEPIRGRGK